MSGGSSGCSKDFGFYVERDRSHSGDSKDEKRCDVRKLRGKTAKNVPNLIKIHGCKLNEPPKIDIKP